MPFSITDLITPVSQADAMNTMLSIASSLGLPTTSWAPGNWIRTLLATVAQKVSDVSVMATQITRGGFGDLLSTDAWGDAWAQSIYGVTRILATQATGAVDIVNASVSTLSLLPGELIVSHVTTGKTYRNIGAITIVASATTLAVPIAADAAGTASNAAPNAITIMVSTQNGLSCNNPLSVIGTDAETTPELVTRARSKLGSLSPNGPRDAYNYVAKTLAITSTPITRTNTIASPTTGVVSVYCANSGGSPSGTDIAAVQSAIDNFATPWGTTATVIASTPLVIPVTYQVWTKGSSLNATQMQTAIASSLAVFFATLKIGGDVIPPDTGAVYVDAIQTAIANAAPGIRRVVVTLPAVTQVMTPNQVATLGTVTGTVTTLVN